MLSDNLFALNHKDNLLNFSIVIRLNTVSFLNMLVSSAKGVNLIGEAEPMSLISIKNRKGSETES